MPSTWIRRHSAKSGKPPGTLIHVGEVNGTKPKITCFEYSKDVMKETQLHEDIAVFLSNRFWEDGHFLWLHVEGVNDLDLIKKIGTVFGIDSLTLEDISETGHRPKLEEFQNYMFAVIKSISIDSSTEKFRPEQISLILGEKFLITFREKQTPLFDPIVRRLITPATRMRNSGVDYLCYSILDLVVDNYFVVLERVAEKIEKIESIVIDGPNNLALESIYKIKKDLLFLRKSVWPLREICHRLINGEMLFMEEGTKPYIRDVLDHTMHAVDTTETYRDITTGLLDIYLSAISARMNQVMKLLTIIGTIFMPLSFLAGWYGMNFKYMPEYDWKYGYPAVIAVALSIIVSMLIVFKRRKWM